MIEQIALAHMNVGRLQFRSATAGTADAAKIYGGMATQLMGEFRRTALALQAFRLAASHVVSRVVLEAPRGAAAAPIDVAPEPEGNGTELINNEALIHDDGTIPFPREEPEASRGGAAECDEARRIIA